MPLIFPAHQGLILPVARKWPNSFDVLALCVGAAMPDIIDSTLGIYFNGHFKHWYGHSLVGMFVIDLPGGLLITWMITFFVAVYLKYARSSQPLQTSSTNAVPKSEPSPGAHAVHSRQTRLSLWTFSIFVGILSHLAFDLISHNTNVLLFPWYNNLVWFPGWWYTAWFELPALTMFGRSYTVGPFTVMWCILTVIGTVLFFRFFYTKNKP